MTTQFEASALPPRARAASAASVAALVIGLVAFLMVWIPVVGIVSWLAAPLGLALGIVGLMRPGAKGAAIAAIILSTLALGVCLMWWSAAEGTVQVL